MNNYQLNISGSIALPVFNTNYTCHSDEIAMNWAGNVVSQITGSEFYRFHLFREEKLIAELIKEMAVQVSVIEAGKTYEFRRRA